MPTTFLLRREKDGTLSLRHGHAAKTLPGQKPKVQWHSAESHHRDDPDGHEREESWTNPQWSNQGIYVPDDKRDAMVAEAKYCHDQAAIGRRTHAQYALVMGDAANGATREETPSIIYAPPAQTTTSTVTPSDTSDLEDRVGSLEELHIIHASQLKAVNESLGILDDDVERVANRVSVLEPLQDRVKQLEESAKRHVTVTVNIGERTNTTTGVRHMNFEKLLRLAAALGPNDRNIWLAGPAGSGKTSAAFQLAEALGLECEFMGALDTPYKLSGYLNPTGVYVTTAFRRIYENGGVILLDEIDGSAPGALLEINAALAGAYASFPDKMIKRHADCYVLGAANTWGFGGDANYVGRNKLDAAFLDRWVTLSWPYDPELERHAAPHVEWVRVVQAVRDNAATAGAQIVISPRASIKGAQLLNGGLTPAEVVEAIFGRYRTHSTWSTVGREAEEFAKRIETVAVSNPTPKTAGDKPRTPGVNLNSVNFSKVRTW